MRYSKIKKKKTRKNIASVVRFFFLIVAYWPKNLKKKLDI